MKKSLSIVLCIFMIATTFCSCKFIKSKENMAEYTTTEKESVTFNQTVTEETESSSESSESKKDKTTGKSEAVTIYVTDKNGEYVTNKKGEKVTEIFDVESLESQLASELEKQSTTKSGSSSTNDLLGDTQSSKEDLLPEGSKTNNTTLMKTKIEPVLKSGTYTIKGSIKTGGQSINTTVAFRNSGKDFSVTASMSGFSIKAFSADGKYYIAFPMFAKYAEVSQEEIGDMSAMTDNFKAKNATYVKTTTVKDGKTTYTCEEYKNDSGTVKYYFDSKNEWKRMEVIQDSDVFVWEISSFTNKADSSLFAAKGMIKDNSLFEGM